ncbi:MAG: FAD-dependent oxidoreductase [Spirochaetes bacterium]|jgi:NADPH-dependent 2,4-dienoyl-CoA reductase/sulfur reductase-like enzyme|nr:FAD-dependent oxidoreductase [Spirochaetota bacterium]
MTELEYDVLIIGGGAAGMAAAMEVYRRGFTPVIVEREAQLGGILLQCIHNGFGLQEFKKEFTGPEYAEEFINQVREAGIDVFLSTTVIELSDHGDQKEAACFSSLNGVLRISAQAVILAMGCRERNRGNIRIPGTRPAGVYTAGLAQRLVNIEGYIPGKDVVVIGSGDIGLIMARRMTWIGAKVHGVVEIQPYPSGLTRNIVQCLNDFQIPLYLSHVVSEIRGRDRVESVEVTPLENGIPDTDQSFEIACDTVLLSVGLIPENELSKEAGVELNPQTGGPLVDSTMMSTVEGIFSCGNVLHVHDLVDFVSEESKRTGGYTADYLTRKRPKRQIQIRAGANIKYVNPAQFNPDAPDKLYMRSLVVKNNAKVQINVDNVPIRTIKKNHVQPSEMISVKLREKDLEQVRFTANSVMEVSVQ